jgi:hypothetical protein
MSRLVTATALVGALLSFALPFGAVSSCDGAEVRFTGADLVTYSVPGESGSDRELAAEVEDFASLFAIGAVAAAAAGLVVLALGLPGIGVCAALGIVAIQLVAYGIAFASDDADLLRGYGLSILGFAVAGLACLAAAIDARDARDQSVWRPLAAALAVLVPPLGLLLTAVLAALAWLVRRVVGRLRGRPQPV